MYCILVLLSYRFLSLGEFLALYTYVGFKRSDGLVGRAPVQYAAGPGFECGQGPVRLIA